MTRQQGEAHDLRHWRWPVRHGSRRSRTPETQSGAPVTQPWPGTAAMPPEGARNLVIVILDSLRHDSWAAARMPILNRLGTVERRWSYASWTAPSHYNLLMGLLPHSSPGRVYASEYYKRDFLRYS